MPTSELERTLEQECTQSPELSLPQLRAKDTVGAVDTGLYPATVF